MLLFSNSYANAVTIYGSGFQGKPPAKKCPETYSWCTVTYFSELLAFSR
jgi:hypothetical protein